MTPPSRNLKVFSGSSHPTLAQEICEQIGIPLGKSSTTRFSNENLKIRIEENVREQDVFVVQTACSPLSENIVELLITLDALKHASAKRVTAVIPYFPYGRSDKKDEPRISISARLMADLLATSGADRVLTMDLHSPQIQGFFSIPADQLTGVPALCARLKKDDLSNTVVVAADVGEAKDAGRFAKRLELPLALIDKRRYGDDEMADAVTMVGEVRGKRALLVDDEISTAGTVVGAAKTLLEHGAKDVSVAVVHPVFSGPAVERLRASPIFEVVVTDSIPLPPAKQDPRFKVLTIAPLIAESISRVHDGRSISELFDGSGR